MEISFDWSSASTSARSRVIVHDDDFDTVSNASDDINDNTRPNRCINFIYQSQTNCTICTEEFQLDERLSILECSHIFHADCLKRWLDCYRNNCPLCRRTT